MKKLSKIIAVLTPATSISQTAFAAEIPIESALYGTSDEVYTMMESLIGGVLDEVQNGLGYQPAWAKANRIVYDAVLAHQTNGHGYAELAGIARNAIYRYRDMYLRPEYYAEQDEKIRQMLSDLIVDVQNGKPYYEAIDEAYTRIYKSVDPNYEPNNEIGVDRIYLDIPAVDGMMFARAKKFLLEAVPKTE